MAEGLTQSLGRGDIVAKQSPPEYPAALRALSECFAITAQLVCQRRMHLSGGRARPRARILRPESVLNTPLFVGFVSELWLTTSVFAASPAPPGISPPGSRAWEHDLEVLSA